jgi:dienelactone hydrolase
VGDLCAADPTHAPDPSTWGPFPVGVKTFEIDSLGYEHKPRHMVIEVWYPATDAYVDGPFETINLRALAPPEVLEVVGDIQIPPIPIHQVRDAAIRAADGPYPMVMFSHGAFGIRFQSVFWTAYLASHGYVVAAMDHSGNTLFDMILAGGYNAEGIVFSALDRPYDVQETVDAMLERNRTEGDFFEGTILPDKLGMSGHSFGGLATFMAGLTVPGMKAAVPMAPATQVLPVMGYDIRDFEIPVMLMADALDRTLDPEVEMYKAYERLPAPKYLFDLLEGGHFTYSDICLLDLKAVAAQLEISGADNALGDGCGDTNIPTSIAHPMIRQFGIGFLNHILRDSEGSKKYYEAAAAEPYAAALRYLVAEPEPAPAP